MSKSFAAGKIKCAGWTFAGLAVAAVALLAVTRLDSRTQRTHSPATVPAATTKTATAEQRSQVRASLGALPLAFEANEGQSDPRVKYLARGNGYTLFLTANDAVFAVHSSSRAQSAATGRFDRMRGRRAAVLSEGKSAAIHMQMLGANAHPAILAGSQAPGVINYYIGNDRSRWHEGVKQYSSVDYRDVYPGVDVVYHGEQRQLEFDFIVAPGASAGPIQLGFSGASRIATDDAGNLVLSSSAGDVLLHKPVAYQEKNGQREPVEVAFQEMGANEVGFALGAYDHNRELVIDPTLTYATYFGGNNEDEIFGIAIDSKNNVYVTGESESTTGFPGGDAPTANKFYVFVSKLTSSGVLTYTTFLGGTPNSTNTNNDSGYAVAADSSGSAYVTGITDSTTFPIVSPTTAPQPTKGDNGGNCTNLKGSNSACSDAFALKLNSTGTPVWSTFIGGQNADDGYAIALDSMGNVWVAGDTFSSSFYPNSHATTTPLYTDFNNGSTLSPPPDDGFVVEINNAGTAPFLYSTYLGGSFADQVNGIAIDGSNNVYVTGETGSTDFPTTGGAYKTTCGSDGNCNAHNGAVYDDAFVTKITAGGGSLSYSTYIGGSSDDYAFGIAVDGSGDAYITGQTTDDDTHTTPPVPYPTTSGAYSPTYNSSASSNAFVTEVNPNGTGLVYSTFLGGSVQDYGNGIAVDQFGDTYVTGGTLSSNFPVTNGSTLNNGANTTSSDAFVTEFLIGGAQLGFSTYLGGSGNENAQASGAYGSIALDSSNNMWVAGSTNSTNFPTAGTPAESAYGGGPYDGFIAEYSTATLPAFSVTATTPSAVNPGSSATSTVTLTSIDSYSGSVTLSCAVAGGGSPAPSCSASNAFSTNPVTPTASGAAATLTITTTGSTAAMYRRSSVFYAMWLPIVGLSLVGVRFSGKDSRKKKLLGFLMLGIVMAMLFFLPACGGSSSSGGGGGGCSGCTPAGNYTVTITGTDTNNVAHSTSVTLTVN